MAGPSRPGSPEYETAVLIRVARVEEQVNHLSGAFREHREYVDERFEQVVHEQATGEHEMRTALADHKRELAGKLDKTNDTLDKINGKLTIHNFIFGVISAIGLAAVAAFMKSLFDTLFN